MYAKLALRNARRSYRDYLLYVITLATLSAIMMFSNLLAEASNQNGFQANAIPLLICMVMMALLSYINGYMIRRRAKEFATYMLLGMKKSRMAVVFFGESLLMGAGGLVIGMALGGVCYPLAISFLQAWFPLSGEMSAIYGVAIRNTCLYFAVLQVISLLVSLRKIRKLQIGRLLSEDRRNQQLRRGPSPGLWTVLWAVCMALNVSLVHCITSGIEIFMLLGTNLIIFSLVLGVLAFYNAAFHWLVWLRQNRRSELYHGNRLYFIAQLLSKITSNIQLNTVLSVCLLFSMMCFSEGLIMPAVPAEVFPVEAGVWMSFAQICLCIVFIVIYFCILAVRQIIEAGENCHAYRILGFLGKNKQQTKNIILWEILVKYSFPAMMCFIVLLLCIWPFNTFLNTFLLSDNLLFTSIAVFTGCFAGLYLAYTAAAYRLSLLNIE